MLDEDPPWTPHPDAALQTILSTGDRAALLSVLTSPRWRGDPYARMLALDGLHRMGGPGPELLQAWLQAMLLGNRPLRAWRVTTTWPRGPATPPEAQLLAAQVAQAVGRADEARARYLGLIQRHPRWVDAWQKYVEFERSGAWPATTAAVLNGLLASATTPYDREKAGFALARVLSAEAPGHAFSLAARSQAMKRQRKGPWDRAALGARLRADLARRPAQNPGPCSEVFITGLPRSGTTLLASLLGAHSAIANVGEQNLLPALERTRSSPSGFSTSAAWYRAAVGDLADKARIVVDKLPGNAERAGLALQCLPGALVVHLERELDDCATSIHMHDFEFGCDYASDPVDLGHYAMAISGHLARHASLAAGRLVHLRFEDLVQSPEAALRPLLERMGLAWEPAMLDFWQADVQTATYSEAQVRSPVHQRAVGNALRFLPESFCFLTAVRAAAGNVA